MGSGGYAIPSICEPEVIQFDAAKCKAKFILHVEKDTVWQRFNEDKFWLKHNCIVSHGAGQPPRGVRRLARRPHRCGPGAPGPERLRGRRARHRGRARGASGARDGRPAAAPRDRSRGRRRAARSAARRTGCFAAAIRAARRAAGAVRGKPQALRPYQPLAAIAAGGTTTFLLDVNNLGPSAVGTFQVQDSLPAGLTPLSASVAAMRPTSKPPP